MANLEVSLLSSEDFFDRLIIDNTFLRKIVKDAQASNETNVQFDEIEKELALLNCDFVISNKFPNLSKFVIQREVEKLNNGYFAPLSDFDEKTEKLKVLEKALKKDPENEELSKSVNALIISRDIEKVKFSELIKERNQFNKNLKSALEKSGL